MTPQDADRGWKAFFALLMLLQIVALGVMWRTYDAIADTRKKSDLSQYRLDHIVEPAVRDHETRIKHLERAHGPGL